MPLVEGHSDTRSRWTANLTTFSNKERIQRGEFPYAEFMFKADGEVLQAQLREHLRSRGYGSWASAATSEKASYRGGDILEFLDVHLPAMTQSRQWRVAMADDFSAHKTDIVFRLCWRRGYVLVPHGGGATPVAQTPDTDLNQHVRREYTARESAHIIEEMRRGVGVPKTKHTKCIDLMMEVLSDPKLHLHAADGYKKTGANVALDGTEDHMIVREAGEFFRWLTLREKINREVDTVRHEVRAGRLRWTCEDVRSLIQPYPKRKGDEVLQCIGEHHQLDSADEPWQDEAAVAESETENESAVAESDDANAEAEEANSSAVAADSGSTAVAVARQPLSEAAAEQLRESEALMARYRQAQEIMRECGAMAAV